MRLFRACVRSRRRAGIPAPSEQTSREIPGRYNRPLPTGAAYADEGNADLVAFLSCIDGSYARHVAGAFVVS